MRSYLIKHWAGQLRLAIAFWVNFALPVTTLLAFQSLWLDEQVARGEVPAITAVLILGLVYLVLLSWQVVGINRSLAAGSSVSLFNDKAVINIGIACVVVYLLMRQMDLLTSENSFGKIRPLPGSGLAPLAVSPVLLLDPSDATRLRVLGSIGIAATRLLKEYLAKHPQVETLVLDSQGGNIFEARGLGKVIADRGLATHVDELCFSACTLIFVNGQPRTAAESARFGFHAYQLDALYPDVLNAVLEQQQKDTEVFRKSGVAQDFIDKIYQVDASGLWVPAREELINAGYLLASE